MGQAIEPYQLNLLGVDHHQLQLLRRIVEHQASDEGVDTHRLAGAGRPGDEQVGQLGQIGHHWSAGHVAAQRDTQ